VIAAGTASANAHGHDTTSTASVASNARAGSMTLQTAAHSAASVSVRATNPAAARSPARASRGRSRPRCRRSAHRRGACTAPSIARQRRGVDPAEASFSNTPSAGSHALRDVGAIAGREFMRGHTLSVPSARGGRRAWCQSRQRVGEVPVWWRARISR
jgi:hypothetical protein